MLTLERLHELLDYDQSTGVFTRRIAKGGHRVGEVAGTLLANGYIQIGVGGRFYLAHRLAWFYVHGSWPGDEIDHRERQQADNRIEHLRPATSSQNKANQKRRVDNTTGFKGVYRRNDTGRYQAHIYSGGRRQTMGCFDTPEEAHAVYVAKARELFGEFARAG